jgi:4-aminobutyrate aminotransferase/(S)-3-amino-2-methylpropionate transaminase
MAPLSEFPLPAEDSSGNELPELRVAPPGPLSRSAALRLAKVECPAFLRRRDARAGGADPTPITLASGRGSNLYDVDGNRYVDLVAGFGALPFGHGATSVVRAMEAQTDRIVQGLGDIYAVDAKLALLERLASLHPGAGPRVLLGQTGSDAVTAAIKTATLATRRPGLVAFEGGYHGLGYGPLAACGLRASYRAPFAAQLNPHVSFVPYPKSASDLDRALSALEAALTPGEMAAVLVEPILGRGGCVVPPDGFIGAVCEAAHRHGALVIADEVWTGLGRTGAMVRTTALGAAVDIICLGKALGGGLPISACIAPDAIMQGWAREAEVVHTSTHAGAPLACAAAVATLDTLRFRQLVTRSHEVGARAKQTLQTALAGAPGVVEVRGEGLLLGIELATSELAARTTHRLLERGYLCLTGGAQGEVITWTPALTIDEELLVAASRALREAL